MKHYLLPRGVSCIVMRGLREGLSEGVRERGVCGLLLSKGDDWFSSLWIVRIRFSGGVL
jgi:hypothetical protein